MWVFLTGYEIIKSLSGSIHVGGFISGTKVCAYAYEHGPERKMILSAYLQMLQAVVVKDAVIEPLTGSTLTVDGPEEFRTLGDAGMETEVCMFFHVDRASVTAGGTLSFIRAGRDASAPERAAVPMCIFYRVISPRAHFMPCPAKWVSHFC